jgi:hypothetical protein
MAAPRPAATVLAAALAGALLACGGGQPSAVPDALAAVSRLAKVHDYPMYLLDYQGDYRLDDRIRVGNVREPASRVPETTAWACTAFAAFGDATRPLVGRSFDWRDHAAILLRTDPSDGFASTTMVDPTYMGFGTEDITRLPANARQSLLEAPFLPVDGLNEHGLAMALLAVPQARAPYVAGRPTLGPLLMIRMVLDRSRTVSEALSLLAGYNLQVGDPPVHFFLADATGQAAIVEYVDGEIVVTPNDRPWLAVTNFVVAGTSPEARPSLCARHRTAVEALAACGGRMASPEALTLLSAVSQPNTMWSVVYELSGGRVTVAPGRDFSRPVVWSLTAPWPGTGLVGLTGPVPGA